MLVKEFGLYHPKMMKSKYHPWSHYGTPFSGKKTSSLSTNFCTVQYWKYVKLKQCPLFNFCLMSQPIKTLHDVQMESHILHLFWKQTLNEKKIGVVRYWKESHHFRNACMLVHGNLRVVLYTFCCWVLTETDQVRYFSNSR